MNYCIKKIKDKLKNSQNMENAVYFSIIVPVYNTEKYLSRCLDSIVYQSFDDMEIIIVDDCSEGNCFEIIEEYRQNNHANKNIKYIRNEQNLGSAWSRLNGLSEATGKYIHFVDSDDWVEKECYKKIYKYLAGNFDALYFNGQSDIVQILLDANAGLNLQDNFGHTALVDASKQGYNEVAKQLIDAKANLNIQNIYGKTALILASFYRHGDIVKLLVDAGANKNIKDNDGKTALMYAREKGYSDIVSLLNR